MRAQIARAGRAHPFRAAANVGAAGAFALVPCLRSPRSETRGGLRHMMKAMLAGTIVLSLAAAPAFAGQDKAKTGSSADGDSMFVTNAAKGGMAEVDLGKLAASKGSSDQVKQFGQRMVDDHSKANDELKALAQSKNITLPSRLDAKDKATHSRLAKLSGAAFDRAYMQHMLDDHRTDVGEFKRESTLGKDPEVKAWATKTLPTLEEHLKLAQDANREVGTSGSTTTPRKPKGTSRR
jgi:putative membrane protein